MGRRRAQLTQELRGLWKDLVLTVIEIHNPSGHIVGGQGGKQEDQLRQSRGWLTLGCP